MRTFYSKFSQLARLHSAIAGIAVAALGSLLHAEDATFKIGVLKSLFMDISDADARIAIDLLLKESNEQSSKLEVAVYSDQRKYFNDIREGNLSYFPLLTTSYLQLKREGVPIRGANVVVKLGDSPCSTYLLLAKKGNYKLLSEARKGTLIVESKFENPLKEIWLKQILHELQVEETPEAFFGHIKSESNARKALFPVFFEQADLCLIKEESWTLLNELNPQLSTQLDIIAQSAPLLETLNCIYEPSVTAKQLNSINTRLFSLSQSIQGRTLLKFSKVKHFAPFQENLLNEVEKLTQISTAPLALTGQ